MESKSLMALDQKSMLERIDAARFPEALNPAEKKMLAMVAITYGFDPLMGEITIYQGKPYVSIDGRYRKAQETNRLMGMHTRPATKQEREDWEIPAGDYFFHSEAEVYNPEGKFTSKFEGWGRVFKAETVGGKGFKPVEKNPQRMAEKRAEVMALRKAFHINLPSFEEMDMPGRDDVDVNTGEIKDRPVIIDQAKAEKDIRELYPEPPQSAPAPVKDNGNPPIPKVSNETFKALQEAQGNAVVTNSTLAEEVKKKGWTAKSMKDLTQPQAEVLIAWLKEKAQPSGEAEEQIPF